MSWFDPVDPTDDTGCDLFIQLGRRWTAPRTAATRRSILARIPVLRGDCMISKVTEELLMIRVKRLGVVMRTEEREVRTARAPFYTVMKAALQKVAR
jgi:hypothetical protein